jgi:poly(3-hydroxybutyrate) depolymerase
MRRVAVLCAAVALAALSIAATAAAAPPRVLNDWPCRGCFVQIPANAGHQKLPMLVALHGDEGNSAFVRSIWGPIADAMHVVLFAPQCPSALGCEFPNGAGTTNSWWGWLQAGRYDDGWLGRQTATVERRFRVDPSREYLEGWSGGADFLGWYALRHADRFAAAAFVAGGVPYTTACPSRALAGLFLMGGQDFRYASGQPEQVRAVLTRCGSVTADIVVPQADHQGTIMSLQTGQARQVLTWLLRRRLRRP